MPRAETIWWKGREDVSSLLRRGLRHLDRVERAQHEIEDENVEDEFLGQLPYYRSEGAANLRARGVGCARARECSVCGAHMRACGLTHVCELEGTSPSLMSQKRKASSAAERSRLELSAAEAYLEADVVQCQ